MGEERYVWERRDWYVCEGGIGMCEWESIGAYMRDWHVSGRRLVYRKRKGKGGRKGEWEERTGRGREGGVGSDAPFKIRAMTKYGIRLPSA